MRRTDGWSPEARNAGVAIGALAGLLLALGWVAGWLTGFRVYPHFDNPVVPPLNAATLVRCALVVVAAIAAGAFMGRRHNASPAAIALYLSARAALRRLVRRCER